MPAPQPHTALHAAVARLHGMHALSQQCDRVSEEYIELAALEVGVDVVMPVHTARATRIHCMKAGLMIDSRSLPLTSSSCELV